VIIGVVYSLVISKIESPNKKMELDSFNKLPKYLKSLQKEKVKVSLVCPEKCDECFVYMNGVKQTQVKSFFDESVLLYRYTYEEGFVQKRSNECFRLSVDKHGVFDQVAVVYKEKVYDYTNYFDGFKVYDSLSSLQDAKEKMIEKVKE